MFSLLQCIKQRVCIASLRQYARLHESCHNNPAIPALLYVVLETWGSLLWRCFAQCSLLVKADLVWQSVNLQL